MKKDDIQKLIDNKLKPNVAEWTMEVEDILQKTNNLTDERKELLKSIRSQNLSWNEAFPEKSDTIVAILKKIIKNMKESPESSFKGEDVAMVKENVFIVYSHQNRAMMLEIKDFLKENLGFEPKTLDIAEYTGSVWDAFIKKSAECQKAIVIMSDDDEVINTSGNTYKQARPNVFIELGYMIHKCGLNNVTIIYSENCSTPSDLNGITSVRYKTEKWTESLRKQLNR